MDLEQTTLNVQNQSRMIDISPLKKSAFCEVSRSNGKPIKKFITWFLDDLLAKTSKTVENISKTTESKVRDLDLEIHTFLEEYENERSKLVNEDVNKSRIIYVL